MTALKEAADQIINSSEIKTLLSEYLLIGSINAARNPNLIPYENLLRFQIDQSSSLSEGYQIGEPWSGYMEKALVLFVSKAPSYSVDEIFPRYLLKDKESKEFKIVKTSDVSKADRTAVTFSDVSEVIAFFNSRFQNALSSEGNGLYVELEGGRLQAVKYWGAMRNNTRTLLPKNVCAVRDVINYFACTSIVPFKVKLYGKYKKAFDSANTMQTSWQKFSQNIITESEAPVIVLVGQEVFDTFTSGFNIALDQCILKERSKPDSKGKKKDIYLFEHRIGKTMRYIVNIASNQGDMRNFHRYFVKNSKILKKLRKIVADSLRLNHLSCIR